jgi:hypothetical protein
MTIVGRTKEDVSTLPAWARRRIERLEQEVISEREKALSASSPEKTNVTVVADYDHNGRQLERGLPKNSKVKFRLDEHFTIDISHQDGLVEVRSSDGQLIIEPAVSNAVYVKASYRR